MGVHGLATFLRENRSSISQTLVFSTTYDEATPFVIDGWSFIYEVVALSGLPWVYGGEYSQFSEAVARVVHAWLSVGLRLYFVFDGSYPDLKFPTLISRITQAGIQPSLLFFRTSAISRSAPRFLHETTMLPPLMYAACVQTLARIAQTANLDNGVAGGLELHFADEEGDPYAVELAARLGGYVVGKDSDFVVLNSEGYAGYIPLDEMVWTAMSESGMTSPIGQEDDDGFQTVVNSKSKKKAASKVGSGHGILPPEDPLDLQLVVTVYSPLDLASHLQLPASLLPLLGALVGNDFTGSKEQTSVTTARQINLQWLFFDRQLTLSQRITRVAGILTNILTAALAPGGKNKQNKQVHSVMELIDRAVSTLMIRSLDTMASGERERVVERVVDATLQYAIPRYEGDVSGADGLWTSGVCALHNAESCPFLRYTPQTADGESDALPDDAGFEKRRESVRALYIAAYRAGRLDPHTLDPMHTGTFWYRQFLENPDLETAARTFARPIQLWCYALLEDGLGLPERPREQEGSSEAENPADDLKEDDDDDELVDVVEDDSDDEDPLAPLRGALRQLGGTQTNASQTDSENPVGEPTSSVSSRALSSQPSRSKIVVEYIRRGTRLADEEVIVPSLAQLTGVDTEEEDNNVYTVPIQLLNAEERLSFMLKALDSGYAPIRSLPIEQRIPSLTVRWVVSRLSTRARESGGSREREKERWTKHEARAFLASFSWLSPSGPDAIEESVPIADRNVQLLAQVVVTMDTIERLSQLLLVDDQLSSPTLRFSGKLFHAYLTGAKTVPADGVPDRLWQASTEELDDAFIEPTGKRRKKDRRKEAEANSSSPPRGQKGQKQNATPGLGKFGLLAMLDA